MTTRRAGRLMAEERGAFDVAVAVEAEPDAPVARATATIAELLSDAQFQAVMALRMELPRMAA